MIKVELKQKRKVEIGSQEIFTNCLVLQSKPPLGVHINFANTNNTTERLSIWHWYLKLLE